MQVLRPDAAAAYGAMSLGAYLERHRYSEAFKRNYLLPMCAAVWSVPNAQVGPEAVTVICGSSGWLYVCARGHCTFSMLLQGSLAMQPIIELPQQQHE